MTTPNENAAPPYLKTLVEDTVGRRSVQWTRPDCGLSAAHRFSVTFDDNSKVFVKAAVDEETLDWLRTEHLVLSSLDAKFMPRELNWVDTDNFQSVLITQDLSDAYWPASHRGVTWRNGDFDHLFESLRELSSIEGSLDLPPLENRTASIWAKIAENPENFLKLQICSANWFRDSIDALIDAEQKTDVTGSRLVHGDIRSDNLCIAGSQVIFVDWSHAARGNGIFDLANLLPTLYLEGGLGPYEVMPDGGGFAASSCARDIVRLAGDRGMPVWLRNVFNRLIAIRLEWAADCLGLEKPATGR